MPFDHNPALIQEYGSEKRKHGAYDKSVEMYCILKQHANGEVPTKIICNRRPGESDRIKDYRIEIYEPMTRAPINKIISSLSKIRRSPDWSVKFDPVEIAAVAGSKDETPEAYFTTKYPNDFTSLTNWVFTIGLKEYLLDSNAVVLVQPLAWVIENTEYYKPFPFVFNAPQVLDFFADRYAVLLSDEQCSYDIVDERGVLIRRHTDGKVIIVVDNEGIFTYNQINQKKEFRLVDEKFHELGFMPAFKMPGVFFEVCRGVIIKESRINSMVPDLNEAARLYSDLQAEYVQHVHSDKWEYMNTRCTHCAGTGQILLEGEEPCSCRECKGAGYVPTSPYTVRVLTPPEIGEEPVPTPPAGYIQKTDVAEMCNELKIAVAEHKYSALAAVNMQNLDQVPLAESGVSKEWDRDEQSNFVHAVAEDLVYIMDKIIFISTEYRYRVVVSDKDKRKALLPNIPVPERFDLFSVNTLATDVSNAKKENVNSFIVAILESEFASKKFQNEPEIARLVQLSYSLDPLIGLTEDEKIARVQNEGVTKLDYIISSNLISFIKRALRENPDFDKKTEDEQLAILTAYATEKEQSITSAGRIQQALNVAPVIEEEQQEEVIEVNPANIEE